MKLSKIGFTILAVLALAAAGCSASTPAPATSAPVATVAAVPTVPPTVAPSPTTAATVAPLPTAAATEPPLATVTTMPAATTAPAATAGAAPAQAASGSCANPFYPVQSGKQWVYQTTMSGSPTSTYTLTYPTISDTGFTERRQFAGFTSDIGWQCTAAGLVSSQFADLNVGAANNQLKLQTGNVQGITIPPADQWRQGASWKTSMSVTGQLTSAAAQGSVDGTIASGNTIAGQESVTVPAGTYNAMRVNQTVTETLNTTVGTIKTPINLTLQVTSWYAQGVGLVKSQYNTDNGSITVELVALK